MSKSEPHFLTTAVNKHILYRQQALEILEAQSCDEISGLHKVLVGEIGQNLCYLSPLQCNEIETHNAQSRSEKENQVLGSKDIVDHPHNKQLYIRSEVFVSVISALLLVGFALQCNFNWDVCGAAAGIITVVAAATTAVIPKTIPISLHYKAVRKSLPLILPAVPLALIWLASELYQRILVDKVDVAEAGKLLDRMSILAGATAINTILMCVLLLAQKQEKRHLIDRFERMSRLASQVNKFLAGTSEMSKEQMMHQIVRSTAACLAANPWLSYARKFIFSIQGPGAVSVWLMTPSASGGFQASIVESPGASREVEAALEAVKTDHRAAKYEEQKFNEALNDCRDPTTGKLDRKKFFKLRKRHTFASLTGYVFAKQQAKYADHASQCLAFDSSYWEVLDRRNLSRKALRWLYSGAVAAYPVMDRPGGMTSGVLLAVTNTPKTITRADRGTLCMAAKLLGTVAAVAPLDKAKESHTGEAA